jgi:hypothetical protein
MPNLLKTWSFFKGTKKKKETFTRPLTQNKKKKLRSPSPLPSTRKNPRPLGCMLHLHIGCICSLFSKLLVTYFGLG